MEHPNPVGTDPTELGRDDIASILGMSIDDVRVTPIEYGLETLTTGGRWWVDVTADGHEHHLVAKLVRDLRFSPIYASIPEFARAGVEAALPWRVETDVYRGALVDALPDGVSMPTCRAIVAHEPYGATIWMDAVTAPARELSPADQAHVARLLGRLAGSTEVGMVADRIGHPSGPAQARIYLADRLLHQFVPAYREGSVFAHPVVADHLDATTRDRLMALVDTAPSLIDEIETLPLLSGHGDACPNNIFLGENGTATLIDWAFFARLRVGFDLSQLLTSEIDLGRAAAENFVRRQENCVAAYAVGLDDVGAGTDIDQVRRAHHLQVAISAGVTTIPLERLDEPPATLGPLIEQRVALLRHILDPLGL